MEVPPQISIVTISFNQARFIESAIRSVIEQDYPHVEYIVVDPGSTDGSRGIIERYRAQIAQFICEPDDGPADGLNRGFAAVTGDVFGFINADDALLPGALRYVANYFRGHPDIEVLLGAGFVIDEKDRILRRVLPSRFSIHRFISGGFEFIQQGMFFRRKAFQAVGGFNVNNRTCWDGELLLEMGLAGMRVARSTTNLALFRLHSDSISGSGRLNCLYACDQERLFHKVMGRAPKTFDQLIGTLFRMEKWVARPIFYSRRFIQTGRFRPQENK